MQKTKPQRILLVENIHPVAKELFLEHGFEVEAQVGSPDERELAELCSDFDVLGIRSKTQLSAQFFESQSRLMAVGAFCIGTNQVDLGSANRAGIPVYNAPYSNTRSVAEMVLAQIICLARQLFHRSAAAHRGEWIKSATGSHEIRGKVLGIVGYGHIGSQLSIMAESLGMRVLYFDIAKKLPLGNAQSTSSLEELLAGADFVSLHVPETLLTKDMIRAKELAQMKKGSYLINASRGSVVVIEDLAAALKEGHIAGAAVDVFPKEPANNKEVFESPLQGYPNVILTPHIGGSTEEAQYAIGCEVAESLIRYLTIGTSMGAVNFPNVELPVRRSAHRVLNVHRNESGVLGEINSIVSQHGGNIEGQYLATDPSIGYLVMDLSQGNTVSIADEISRLGRSIQTRSLL